MSGHRRQPGRPRYGRLAALGSSVAVTAVAVLGGTGVLPSAASTHGARSTAAIAEAADSVPAGRATGPSTGPSAAAGSDQGAGDGSHRDAGRGAAQGAGRSTPPTHSGISSRGSADAVELRDRTTLDQALPLRSGDGRRVVFSQNRQRVWLVGAHDRVKRTYPVSGSVTDNLAAGTYSVYSRSEQAWGIDDSGTMKYFVRFAHGQNAAIGFHDIPIKDGHLLQSVRDLGTPQSHGCIRQRRVDAIALWRFAPLGTTVVVV